MPSDLSGVDEVKVGDRVRFAGVEGVVRYLTTDDWGWIATVETRDGMEEVDVESLSVSREVMP